MTADLTNPVFTNEEAAMAHLEASRWPDGAFCGYCGSTNVTRMGGRTQAGYFNCNDCRQKFTARVGTVLERSKVPVHKWLLAIHLLTSSKKGMSAHQLHRMLGVTYKTAWFMAHRIREAMKDGTASKTPLGGKGKVVETDELYIGKRENPMPLGRGRKPTYTKGGKSGPAQKRVVIGLVERGGLHPHDPHQPRHCRRRARRGCPQRVARERPAHRRKPPLHKDGRGVRSAPHRASCLRRIRPLGSRHDDYDKHGRERVLSPSPWHSWRLSALRRSPSSPLPQRIRVPLQSPLRPWRLRCRACSSGA